MVVLILVIQDCINKADEANCPHFTCKDDGKLEYISLDLVRKQCVASGSKMYDCLLS